MRIEEDVWLSDIIRKKVFKLTFDSLSSSTKRNWQTTIAQHESEHSHAMYYTKISTEQVSLLYQLSKLGFYPVDVNVTFELECDRVTNLSPLKTKYTIKEIASGEEQQVVNIARTCFRYSRFHLDPAVNNEIADRIKSEWVFNYIRKQRGDRLFVASMEEKTVGFLAAIVSEKQGKKIGIIDLIGIDRQYQRQGIGQELSKFFRVYYQEDCNRLRVGTQVANIASQRLYQKVGFSLSQSQYVLHKHLN